jgi:hypothetical protein
MNSLCLFLDSMHIGRGMMNIHGMNNNQLVTFSFPMLDRLNILILVMSLLIFSYLFTRRRLSGNKKPQDPYLSVAREAACPRKASATSVMY